MVTTARCRDRGAEPARFRQSAVPVGAVRSTAGEVERCLRASRAFESRQRLELEDLRLWLPQVMGPACSLVCFGRASGCAASSCSSERLGCEGAERRVLAPDIGKDVEPLSAVVAVIEPKEDRVAHMRRQVWRGGMAQLVVA